MSWSLEPAGRPAEWEVPGWGAAGLVVRASLRAHAAARNLVRLHYSSHHDPGAALAQFGLARGSGTWAPALGGGEKWDLGTEVESDKADRDLAFFLEAAACCPVLYPGLDMGRSDGGLLLSHALCGSCSNVEFLECQTSSGFGPAFASRGLGYSCWGQGDAEARVASIPLPPSVSIKAGWRRRKRRPPPHPKSGSHP